MWGSRRPAAGATFVYAIMFSFSRSAPADAASGGDRGLGARWGRGRGGGLLRGGQEGADGLGDLGDGRAHVAQGDVGGSVVDDPDVPGPSAGERIDLPGVAIGEHGVDVLDVDARQAPFLGEDAQLGLDEQVLGRRLPLNGAGVCGAALADLGLPVEMLRGFALLARAAGLLGQIAEERRRPIGMDVYLAVDRFAEYVDP